MFFVSIIKDDLQGFIDDNVMEINNINEFEEDIPDLDIVKARLEILNNPVPKCKFCGHILLDSEIDGMKKIMEVLKENSDSIKYNSERMNRLKLENQNFNNFLKYIEKQNYQHDLDKIKLLEDELKTIDEEYKNLIVESENSKYGDLGKINRIISGLESGNQDKNRKILDLDKAYYHHDQEKKKAIRELKRMGHDDRTINNITTMLTKIGDFKDKISTFLDEGTYAKRDKIINKSSELFLNITNKPDEYANLDFLDGDSYAFIIKNKDGRTVTNPSKGEKQIVAMSFLLGLNQYTGRNNVILMDTPIGSLDEIHSTGIGKALSELDNQVIFLAQPMELLGDIYKHMKPSIAKEFGVERKNNVSYIKEGI